MNHNDDIFKFDDAFQDGVFIVPSKCRYTVRKAFEKSIELRRELTDDELAWIAEKEQNGDQIKSNKDVANMNFVMQTYYEIFADMTRDRCYILVNMYMQ